MSVSYLSKPVQQSAYVPPFDLGIYAKVLSIKQQQFDLGAKKEQDNINQLANLDVREVDRPYLNNKINNLVSTINNFGGQDYSDPNILNQIEGLGADIYGDKKVITAVTSMKQARKVLDGYEQYKTNPKLTKLYSASNEWGDVGTVSAWMQNPEVGKAYEGPSSPTPFTPYKDPMIKALKEVKADWIDNVSIDGYYVSKDGTKRITPQRLTDIALKTLTADEQAQIYRDGAYQYRATQPQDLINKSLSQYQQRVDETKSMKLYYESQAASAYSDPNARRNYLQLAADKDNELIALTKDPDKVAKAAVDNYTKDPKRFAGEVYQNDFISGMSNLFSVNQTTKNLSFDHAAMFQERQRTLTEHWDSEYNQKDRQFYDNLRFQGKKDGFDMIVDAEGNISWIPLPEGAGGALHGTSTDTRDPNNIKVTPKSIQVAIDDSKKQQDNRWKQFISEITTAYPNIGIEELSADPNGVGVTAMLKGQQFLEGVNNEPGFQYEDLQGIESNAVQGQMSKVGGMNSSQIQYIIDLNKNFKAVLEGKGKTVGNMPPEFIGAAADIAILKEGEKANQVLLDKAYDAVLAPLNKQEKDLYKAYLKKPEDFQRKTLLTTTEGAMMGTVTDPRIEQIRDNLKLSKADIEKQVQSYLDPSSTHEVFRTKIFTDAERKDGALSGFLAGEINRGVGSFYFNGKEQEAKPLNPVAMKDITAHDTGMMGDGSGQFYISGQVITKDSDNKEMTMEYVVPVSDDNAEVYGLKRDMLDNLNRSVNMLGRTGDLPVYVNNSLALPITIVRPNKGNINSGTYAQAKFYEYDVNGNKIKDPKNPGEFLYTLIPIPNTKGFTASQSYKIAVDYIHKAGENPIKQYDIEGFRNLLIEKNKKP